MVQVCGDEVGLGVDGLGLGDDGLGLGGDGAGLGDGLGLDERAWVGQLDSQSRLELLDFDPLTLHQC